MADPIGTIIAEALSDKLGPLEAAALATELDAMQRITAKLGGREAKFDKLFAISAEFSVLPHDGWRVLATVATTISTGVLTSLTLGTPLFDTAATFKQAGFFDSADPTKITIPAGRGGYYIFGCNFTYSSLSDGVETRSLIVLNDSPALAGQTLTSGAAGAPTISCVSTYLLSAGDYLTFEGFQNDSGDETCKPTCWGFRWR